MGRCLVPDHERVVAPATKGNLDPATDRGVHPIRQGVVEGLIKVGQRRLEKNLDGTLARTWGLKSRKLGHSLIESQADGRAQCLRTICGFPWESIATKVAVVRRRLIDGT